MRATCLCAVAVVSLAAGLTLRGVAGEKTGETELKKLQGTWQFVSQSFEGKERPAAEVEKIKITFSGDKWSVEMDGKVLQAGTHKLDPSKSPAQVDAMVTEGEGKGSTMIGIYERKKGMMKVCFDLKGKERPTSFTAKAGQMAAVIQRDKK